MRILIASEIAAEAIEQLRCDHEVRCAFGAREEKLKSEIAGCEAIIFRSGVNISADVMRASPELRLLIRGGSGFDNVDLGYVQRHGLQFIRIPEPGAKAVAEMAFALMLSLARNVVRGDQLLRQGRWAKQELTGHALGGKVLGIVGAGNIGSYVGRLGAAWDMQVVGCVGNSSPQSETRLLQQGIHPAEFDEVIRTADFLSLHVPLTDSTRNLIDAEALARMKPGAFLINLARGGVVDEFALYNELTSGGRLGGAAMDVHAREGNGCISILAALPNVILTPHIGAGTFDAQREIGRRVLELVKLHGEAEVDPCGAELSKTASTPDPYVSADVR